MMRTGLRIGKGEEFINYFTNSIKFDALAIAKSYPHSSIQGNEIVILRDC